MSLELLSSIEELKSALHARQEVYGRGTQNLVNEANLLSFQYPNGLG